MTIQQKISEIEKGCGNTIVDRHYHSQGDCGLKGYLCPTCQATLSAYLECEKIIKEEKIKMIDDVIKFLDNIHEQVHLWLIDIKWDYNSPKFLLDIEERREALQKLSEDLV